MRWCRLSCLFRFRLCCFWLYFSPQPFLRRNSDCLCVCQVWLLACWNRKLLILQHELRWLCLDLFQILWFIISHFCGICFLLTHWKDCILNWSGAEIIFHLFSSKIIFTEFWLPQLFTFKLSDYLVPLHFKLSYVLWKLKIFKWSSQPLHNKIPGFIEAGNFIKIFSKLLFSWLVFFQFLSERCRNIPLFGFIRCNHISQLALHLTFNRMSFPLDISHFLFYLFHAFLHNCWI